MNLKFPTISDAEVARRVDNLCRHRDAAADAALVILSASHNPMLDAMGTEAEVTARAVVDALTAAEVAEKVYTAKIAADAVVDLYSAATEPPTPPAVRLIAHRIPWPAQKARPSRAGLSLKWRCLTEEGVLLVESTDHPLADSAAVLSILHGLPDCTPVTLRHADRGYDSFGPMKLAAAAAHGIKRLEDRTRLREMRREAV